MFLKRLAAWLALPLTVVAALALGHQVFQPKFEVEANEFEELLAVTPIPRPEEVAIRLIRADGQPAEGGVVVLLDPEISIDYADADGWVRLQRELGGPLRLQAYAPGHELVTLGPLPEEELTEIQFEARIQPQIPELAPERLVEHRLLLRGRDGMPLPGILVVARRPVEEWDSVRPWIEPGIEPSRYEVPWVAFSDEDGWAELEGLPELAVQLESYPAGLPREAAWQLGARQLNPAPEGEGEWRLEVAILAWTGLPPDRAITAQRTDLPGTLPLRRIPFSGTLHWPALPPGEYRFTVGEQVRSVVLYPGSNELVW